MTEHFQDLGVSREVAEALAERGITEPFPIQAMTIPDALAGRDVCGKAKTGSGKTLAFGVPLVERLERRERAVARRPRGLVLAPTRELASQVHEELAPLATTRGVRLGAVYGGRRIEHDFDLLDDGVDALVATPGRLVDLIQRSRCSLADVEVVVVDEADRMADLGFTPQVRWVLRHVEREHQTMLFSATLDGAVHHLIRDYLHDPVRHEVASSERTVAEMLHRFLLVHEMDRDRVVAAIARGVQRTLVFCNTKRNADRLVRSLRKEGTNAAAIHGDLPQQAREKNLDRFATGDVGVLVATDVAARGLHVEGIDVVVQYDPPDDEKTYLHRSGRTARAGATGVAVTLLLYNQTLKARILQRRLGLEEPVVEVFSTDPALGDLAEWDPAAA